MQGGTSSSFYFAIFISPALKMIGSSKINGKEKLSEESRDQIWSPIFAENSKVAMELEEINTERESRRC